MDCAVREVWPGLVERGISLYQAQRETASKAALRWKPNALRHSFISYRLAEVQNAAQVALEAGNSSQMVFKHYGELVKPADADKWFNVQPQTRANVLAMPKDAPR